LAKRFIQRWDIHARQLDDGRYICIHEPLTVDHLFAHLRGEITLGTYLLDLQNQTRFVIFDADTNQDYTRLNGMAKALVDEEIPSYLENSRRGGHLWMFFAEPVLARDARAFARGLISSYSIENIEIFPKQDTLRSGPGSLIRMPFGVHRLTGERYSFIHPDGSPLAQTINAQILALSTPQTVPEAAFDSFRSYVSSEPLTSAQERLDSPTDALSGRIKQSVTVLEFVSQYVELKPAGSGATGLCPFHNDHRPSLGINDQENYWHCFAGCGGGSVIDFWMKMKGCDFVEAVTELAQIVF
jgi:hypothetical protein